LSIVKLASIQKICDQNIQNSLLVDDEVIVSRIYIEGRFIFDSEVLLNRTRYHANPKRFYLTAYELALADVLYRASIIMHKAMKLIVVVGEV